jgi:hypothetical protein
LTASWKERANDFTPRFRPRAIAAAGEVPERLVHVDVMGRHGDDDADFSRDRQHAVHIVDLPSKVISMTIGGLTPGQQTRHRHNYETLIYVLEGQRACRSSATARCAGSVAMRSMCQWAGISTSI